MYKSCRNEYEVDVRCACVFGFSVFGVGLFNFTYIRIAATHYEAYVKALFYYLLFKKYACLYRFML